MTWGLAYVTISLKLNDKIIVSVFLPQSIASSQQQALIQSKSHDSHITFNINSWMVKNTFLPISQQKMENL